MKQPWEPCWWSNRLWYLPILFIIIAGYAIGGYLTFFVQFLDAFPKLEKENARFTIILFGMGILGSALYSSYFFAKDANQVMCTS